MLASILLVLKMSQPGKPDIKNVGRLVTEPLEPGTHVVSTHNFHCNLLRSAWPGLLKRPTPVAPTTLERDDSHYYDDHFCLAVGGFSAARIFRFLAAPGIFPL